MPMSENNTLLKPAELNPATEITRKICQQMDRCLLGREAPPLQSIDAAGLSPMARGFYAENRRVANGKAKRVLGWQPRFATYREGLAAIRARA